jgi:tetratricopeptide (TPR) repeat protein
MLEKRIVTAVLGLCLACAASAQGGIYSTTEPNEGPLNADYRRFKDTYFTLRNIGMPPIKDVAPAPHPLDKRYLLVGVLSARGFPTKLTVEERLNLGAALIRLRRFEEAIRALEVRTPEARNNFVLLSNLATAYHLAGQQRRGLDCLDQALSLWPADWSALTRDQRDLLMQMGWNEGPFAWYRRADTFYRKLLRLRVRESLQQSSRQASVPETLDALFDDGGKPPRPVRFVGESGQYEPGKLARAERDKLPKDALQIVQQLLVWLASGSTADEDLRLYWLMGELYNAQGDPETALEVFNYVVTKMGRFPEMRAHRLVLQSQPRAPVRPGLPPTIPPVAVAAPLDAATWMPAPWQTLGVGFVGGLIVALLGYWQVREIRRRRQLARMKHG